MNGQIAFDLVQANVKEPYNMIFIDLELPIMDGLTTCKMIKKFYSKKEHSRFARQDKLKWTEDLLRVYKDLTKIKGKNGEEEVKNNFAKLFNNIKYHSLKKPLIFALSPEVNIDVISVTEAAGFCQCYK